MNPLFSGIAGKKQLFLLPFLFFILSVPAAPAEEQYYRSNSLGMPLEEVSPLMRDDYSYILQRSRTGEMVEETLYYEGKILSSSNYQYKGELLYGRHYTEGTLVRETVEKRDKLLEEKITEDGATEIRTYQWSGEELRYMEVITGDGKKIRHRYLRSEDGRLLQVIREDLSEGTEAPAETVAEFQYSDGTRRTRQWHIDPGGCTHFFFDDEDSRVHEKYCGGEKTYVYREEREENTFRVTENFLTEDKTVEKILDGKRRPVEITETEGNTLRHEIYRYSEDRLQELTVKKGDSIRRTEYRYAESATAEKKLTGEIQYLNGVPAKEIFYGEDDIRREVLYREGTAVVELLYRGEEVVKHTSLLED